MRGLLLWSAIVAAIASGVIAAPVLPDAAIRVGVVAGWVVALTLIAVGVLRAGRAESSARSVPTIWFVAAVLLAAVRGVVGVESTERPWTETSRGPASGVRVLEVVEPSQPGARCRLKVAVFGREGTSPPILLSAPRRVCPRGAGDRIAVPADALRPRRDAVLPGAPERARWVEGAGAVATAYVDVVWEVERGAGVVAEASRAVARLREAAWDASRGDDAASFVVASSLGLRQALPSTRRKALRDAGLGHLIAVSGLHVGIAAWLVGRVLLRAGTALGGTPWFGVVMSWAFVAAYVGLTGSPPSAVRAGLMAAAAGLGDAVGRPAHGAVLLVAASAAMLVWRPAWLLDAGFQLSVVAMAVLVYTPPDAGIVRSTWRVTWGIVPVALLHFGRVGAWAVVSNLVAVPVVTLWTLPVGLLGSLLVPWLGAVALVPAGWGARAVLDVAGLVASWPVVPPTWLAVMALVSLILTVAAWRARESRGRRRVVATLRSWTVPPLAAIAVVLVVAWPTTRPESPSVAWAAVGSPQRHAVVVKTDPATACLRGSSLTASRWPALLEALGVARVDALEPEPRATVQAPHRIALRAALRDARLLVADPGSTCPGPEPRRVRELLARCRRRAGPGAPVVVVDADGRASCWLRGAFVPFAVD